MSPAKAAVLAASVLAWRAVSTSVEFWLLSMALYARALASCAATCALAAALAALAAASEDACRIGTRRVSMVQRRF